MAEIIKFPVEKNYNDLTPAEKDEALGLIPFPGKKITTPLDVFVAAIFAPGIFFTPPGSSS